jgi:hypothetical protein
LGIFLNTVGIPVVQGGVDIKKKLKKAHILQFKAKDIFRASGLPLLGIAKVSIKLLTQNTDI